MAGGALLREQILTMIDAGKFCMLVIEMGGGGGGGGGLSEKNCVDIIYGCCSCS